MTTFRFDELTYPEVASLPQDTALVLPLGDGYDLSQLADLTGSDEIGILPAIPFGWSGSFLNIRPEIFAERVRSLVSNLREDGFTRVSLLSADAEPLPEIPTLHLPQKESPVPFP